MMKNIFLALLLGVMSVLAQNATFVATIDQTTVSAGEQFQVSFTVSAPDVKGIRNFKCPDFRQFVVLGGPFESTSIQFINGRSSASISYSYSLYARQPGRYTIGAARVEVEGTTLHSQPLQIDVAKGKPQAEQKGAEEIQGLKDNLFIRAVAERQRIKQGEQVTVIYKLYARVQVTGYDIAKAPVYQGFWSEEIDQPKQPAVTTEMYEGKQYRVAMIRKTALFPTQSGKLTVSPLEVRCAVQLQSRRRSNDPFDSFFNDPFFSRLQTVEQEFKSNPLTIVVDPLPAGASAGFRGAVGRFTFTASVDKKEVKTGDPVTLRLSVSGSGNVKLLTLPTPQLPVDFEAYEPKVSDEITREGGVIRGKKTAEYLIVPRNAGQRTVEPMSFVYFDLDRQSYVTARSPRFDFTITAGKDLATRGALASKSDIRLLGEDIRFLKLSMGQLQRVDESPFTGGWFAAAVVLPPVAFIGVVAYRRRRERLSGNLPQLRFQKAGRGAAKRLKRAKRLLAQGNTESYHSEVSQALMGYLEDKLHASRATLTLDRAIVSLQQRGVSTETVESLRKCVERAEFVRFAPASDTQEARTELLDAAAAVIGSIERSYTRQP